MTFKNFFGGEILQRKKGSFRLIQRLPEDDHHLQQQVAGYNARTCCPIDSHATFSLTPSFSGGAAGVETSQAVLNGFLQPVQTVKIKTVAIFSQATAYGALERELGARTGMSTLDPPEVPYVASFMHL